MPTERWQQIEELYHAALERVPDERAAFLVAACANDADLRREVETLLRHNNEAETFLQDHALLPAAHQLDSEELPETQTLLTGQQLGAYQILAPLGKGGMGEVHLAMDTRLQRKVALKLLPAEFTVNAERVRRFAQEARAASALNHPNILTIYDIGEHEQLHYIVTEFVAGETLRQRMTTAAQQPLAATVAVAAQVAEALAAAHEAGIIHRDIKPENVMVRRDGIVKVLDFGLAKLVETMNDERGTRNAEDSDIQRSSFSLPPSTMPGIVMGTPRYMSPEQARGEKVDARSDIFSLGVMLYEMLAQRPPFAGATASEVMAAILRDEPAPLPDVTPELQHILRQALQKERAARYPTMRELLADLKRLQRQLERQEERSVVALPAAEEPTVLQPQTSTAPLSHEQATSPLTTSSGTLLTRRRVVFLLAVIGLVVAAPTAWFYLKRAPALTAKDTILLADFENQTGDAVFDGTLKQGLALQMQQSQFLRLFPEDRVRQTLRQMGRAPNDRVTAEVGREICERQNLKALIVGSIAPLGSHYILTLNALNARSGESLALQQIEAESKEQVLRALAQVAMQLRERLGESLSLIQPSDKPLAPITALKLEALRAYTLSNEQGINGRIVEAIPFMKRAVEIDPDFANAYNQLAIFYNTTARPEAAGEYAKKAYALKNQVSESEQVLIAYRYHLLGMGEINKAVEVARLIKQTPNGGFAGAMSLALAHNLSGQYEQAMVEARDGLRLSPKFAPAYWMLATALLRTNRFAEAKDVFKQALEQQLEPANRQSILYQIACIKGDTAGRQQQIEGLKGKPEEYLAFDLQTGAAALAGQWRQAQEWSRQTIALSTSYDDTKELPARHATEQALRGAMLGDCRQAVLAATQGLQLTHNRTSLPRAALALALCGEANQAKSLADELTKLYPQDTFINELWLPVLRAALNWRRGDAAQALEQLRNTARYEAAAEFWPQYLRGQAYLQLQQNKEAAAEFQKILDHRGQAPLSPLYPLAQLGLARATQSRKAYDDFFALWKEADAELLIYLEAKKEYARLP